MGEEEGPWAITLYVPDATLLALNPEGWHRRRLEDGTGDLDFLVPGWWEGSHTARLGRVPSLHEPQGRAGVPPARRSRDGCATLCPFMVAMRIHPLDVAAPHESLIASRDTPSDEDGPFR
jgi:hypothetical protein